MHFISRLRGVINLREIRPMAHLLAGILAISIFTMGCAGKTQNMASTTDTAVFLPIVADYSVDFFVDQVDGKATKFGVFDRVTIDSGRHELQLRLEYSPASGSSVIVGGIGNLLLRATTNKTFRTDMTLDVSGGHTYQMIARANGENIEIIVFDKTESREVVKQTFVHKNGQFERLF
jgi:hypothetical protein